MIHTHKTGERVIHGAIAILSRLTQVILATLFCIIVFASMIEFLIFIPSYLAPPDNIQDIEPYRRNNPLFGAFWWAISQL